MNKKSFIFVLLISLFPAFLMASGIEKSEIDKQSIKALVEEEAKKANEAPQVTETKAERDARVAKELKAEKTLIQTKASIGFYDEENIKKRTDFLINHLTRKINRERRNLYKRFMYPDFSFKKHNKKLTAKINSKFLNEEVNRINIAFDNYANYIDARNEAKFLKDIHPLSLRITRLESLESSNLPSSSTNNQNFNNFVNRQQSANNNTVYDYELSLNQLLDGGVKVTKLTPNVLEIRREY